MKDVYLKPMVKAERMITRLSPIFTPSKQNQPSIPANEFRCSGTFYSCAAAAQPEC